MPELDVVFPTPPFPPTKTKLGLVVTLSCFDAESVKRVFVAESRDITEKPFNLEALTLQ